MSRDGSTYRPVVKYSGIGAGIQKFFRGWSLKKYVTTDNSIFAYSADIERGGVRGWGHQGPTQQRAACRPVGGALLNLRHPTTGPLLPT